MAPSVEFHGQPFSEGRSAGVALEEILDEPALDRLTLVVAWVRLRGLLRLKPSINAFRERGGTIRAIVGIDEGGATRPGLLGILRASDEAYVFHDPAGGTFHPKIYLAEGPRKAILIVGSSNLTPGGLFVNVEASMSTSFELPAEERHPALVAAREFVANLIEDRDACIGLTEATVASLYADKRYRIVGHERRRAQVPSRTPGTDPEDLDETQSGQGDSEERGSLFAPSRRPRSSVPPLTREDRRELESLEIAEPEQAQQAPAQAVEREVAARWTKQMNRSDAQQVSAGSSPTGALRLTEAENEIDHRIWFRQTFFGAPVVWRQDADGRGNPIDLAAVSFGVRIDGIDRGTFTLMVDHGPHREAGQGNVPTIIHWGKELAAELRAHDRSGQTLTLERFDDDTFRVTIG
jgi:hypothetical protein